MKKTLIVFLIAGMLGAALFGQVTFVDSPFMPKQAEVMGAGGSFNSDARSWNSLIGNPAGFAKRPRSLTLLSVNPWVYVRPDMLLDVVSSETFNPETDMLGFVMDQITTNGIGAGTSFGVGWVGGLALGVMGSTEAYVYGRTQLGIQGYMNATVASVAGIGLPIRFGDNFAILIGGDIRPMYRASLRLPNQDVLALVTQLAAPSDDPIQEDQNAYPAEEEDPIMAILNGLPISYGVGMAIDLGAMVELGPFTVGMSIRDFANTKIFYNMMPFGEFAAMVETGDLPSPDNSIQNTIIGEIPMNVSLGASFHPDLGWFKYILDPRVYADIDNVLGYLEQEDATIYKYLHAGAEAKVLSLLRVRAGFNQGYVTAGVGVKLLFAEINASIFTEELGSYVGAHPRSGLSVEAAIRF